MTSQSEELEIDDIPEPRANPDLVGHEPAERTLLDAFRSDRLAHAWLITGPRGIGKATLAYRFARYVLSASSKANDQAGLFGDGGPDEAGDSLYVSEHEPVFNRVAGSGHADLLTVERRYDDKGEKRKSEIVVDDVRKVSSFLNLTAAEGGWRVVVVDAADELNRNAANALLKVLEEPPSQALLLLVSHSPGRLLPTIRSRCQRLALKPLEKTVLQSVLARFRPDLSLDESAVLSRLAEGSVGRALHLAEEGGVGLYQEFIGLVGQLPALNIKELHAFGDKMARAGREEAFRTFTELAQWWLQHLITQIARREQAKSELFGSEETAALDHLRELGHLKSWLAAWDHISHILSRAESAYLDRKQVILSLFRALEKAAQPA